MMRAGVGCTVLVVLICSCAGTRSGSRNDGSEAAAQLDAASTGGGKTLLVTAVTAGSFGGPGGEGGTVTTGGSAGSVSPAIAGCEDLSYPTNGTVTEPTWSYGSVATYACEPGFAISGSPSRTCEPDGGWSGEAPNCVAVDIVCEPPPSTIANGVVSAPVTKYGATASYYCSSGYSLQGDAVRVCQMDGTWSGAPPTCVCDVSCDGVCTDVQYDIDNCGGCGKICPSPTPPSTTECMLGRCLVTLVSDSTLGFVKQLAVDASSVYFLVDNPIGPEDRVMRVPLEGGPTTTLVTGQATLNGFIPTMAVNASGVYWIDYDSDTDAAGDSYASLMKTPLQGGSSITVVAHQLGCSLLAVDAANIYWVTGSALMKQALDGSGSPVTLASQLPHPSSITVDAINVYLANWGVSASYYPPPDDGSVMMVPIAGGDPVTLAAQQSLPSGIAVGGSGMYWIAGSSVIGAPLGGGAAITLATDQPLLSDVAVDEAYVYWTKGLDAFSGGGVMKVAIGGGAPIELALGQDEPRGIAVDNDSVYWGSYGAVMKTSPK